MYSKIVKDFRQANQEQFLLMNWQVIQNLRGLSDHRTLLVGDAFDERTFLNRPASEIDPYFTAPTIITKKRPHHHPAATPRANRPKCVNH
jgi:hypothetical protein